MSRPPAWRREATGTAALTVVLAAWALALGLIIIKPLFVTHDSVSNYAHVWYVQDRLRHGGGIPFRMPVVGHGDGLAFPYAFLPWTVAALLWPLLGSWSVTLMLVAGAVALVAATFLAFPELRHGWWAAAVLADPALVAAPISGQLPFLWGAALLMAGVGAWRGRRERRCAVLAGLGAATHPAVVGPIGALLAAGVWWSRRAERGALVRCTAGAAALAAPAAALVLASPVVGDTTTAQKVANLVGAVAARGLVFAVPLALTALLRRDEAGVSGGRDRRLPAAAFAAVVGLNLVLLAPLHVPDAVAALGRRPRTDLLRFIDSPAFVAGETYRVLPARDARVSLYEILLHRGRLDSEFFPESMARQSWSTARAYSAFLIHRGVDFVVIYRSYDREQATNEHRLLETLAAGRGACRPGLVGVTLVHRDRVFDAYRVHRC